MMSSSWLSLYPIFPRLRFAQLRLERVQRFDRIARRHLIGIERRECFHYRR
jgi:hypothetical protein